MILRKARTVLDERSKGYDLYGWLTTEAGEQKRVRQALGTQKAGEADNRMREIENAVRDGAESSLWPKLRTSLPARTFKFFGAFVGYADVPKVEAVKPTWATLAAEYRKHLDRPIETGKRAGRFRTQSTKERYLETLDTFGRFLTKQSITRLDEISEQVARVQYQDWRIADIRAKHNHRPSADTTKLPGGYVLDVAILCGVFKFAVAQGMIAKSPFRYCGKPGSDAENGALPFTAKELTALIKHADKDLLAVLLLLRTGLRRSDAIALRWKDVGPTHISIVARKNGAKVRVPILLDFADALDTERKIRFSGLVPDDYANDFVLINPATRSAFNTGKKLHERIKRIGERAGVKRAHPHRFRDTFAKSAFLSGATLDEVAAFLGDKPETVSQHYGWMDTERMAHADSKLLNGNGLVNAIEIAAATLATKARSKVRAMRQGQLVA